MRTSVPGSYEPKRAWTSIRIAVRSRAALRLSVPCNPGSPIAPHSQQGMAVITALLVVVAVTMIVATLLQRQDAFVRAVQSAQTRAEAQALLRGGLSVARRLLIEDEQRTATTRLDGIWAQPIIDTRLEAAGRKGAIFTGRLEDEQGKFNLRNLVFRGRFYVDGVAEWRRLCGMLDVPQEIADRVAQRILVAQPTEAGEDNGGVPGGATQLLPDARIQAPMPRSLDDLRSVEGFDDAIVAKLRPHVTVLPRVTLVNVNTASAEVIAARVPGMTLDQAKALVARRGAGQWFVNSADFFNRLNMPELQTNQMRVSVNSGWFTLVGAARLGNSIMLTHALLVRSDTGLPVVVWSREGA